METVTIPKKLASRGDLVVIPRVEYEALKAHLREVAVIEPLIPSDPIDPDFGLELSVKAKRRLRSVLKRKGKTVPLSVLLKKYA